MRCSDTFHNFPKIVLHQRSFPRNTANVLHIYSVEHSQTAASVGRKKYSKQSFKRVAVHDWRMGSLKCVHMRARTGGVALTHCFECFTLIPPKTSEIQRFPDVFEGAGESKGNIGKEWVK